MSDLRLTQGSRVAVIGGGPAGSFASYFLLDLADRVGLDVDVDIFEPKNFSSVGPTGCNNCGGIISESLVQMLAAEGFNLPSTVVQRGLDSYVLHADVGTVRIHGELNEKRIASVHRGGGPRGTRVAQWESFDGYLLASACKKGARVVPSRVEKITREDGRPVVHEKGGEARPYDLVVGAVGVNSPLLKAFEGLGFRYRLPKTSKTYVAEFQLGLDRVTQYLGNSMHVFLLDLPRLEFAALIPKGEHVTVCLLGHDIDKPLVDRFLNLPEVRSCFPPGWTVGPPHCHCAPRINVGAATHAFADRVVLIGDSAVTRLYKDGIGAAYRTAKACAVTAVFEGVSARDFQRHYWPVCRGLERDNYFGTAVFMAVNLIRKLRFLRSGVVQMVRDEQSGRGGPRPMSMVLWDTFTGSSSYQSIFARGLKPGFLARLATDSMRTAMPRADQGL
jgi:flavin-dependent dehydrogenase